MKKDKQKIKINRKIVPWCLMGLTIVVVSVYCLWRIAEDTPYKKEPVHIESEENFGQEQPETGPGITDLTYTVSVGGQANYVFNPDGVLRVTGTGVIRDFDSLEALQEHLITAIQSQHKEKKYAGEVSNSDALQVINNVKRIEIEEGITEIGKGALATFFYVESVEFPTTIKRVGEAALLGAGQYTEETTWTQLELSAIGYGKTSFDACNGIKKEENGEYIIQSQEDAAKEDPEVFDPEALELVDKVKMGNHVDYMLYSDGTLAVQGTGATYSFQNRKELYDHMKESLCCTTRSEVDERWFEQIRRIIIFDVTYIGDYAFYGMSRVEEATVYPKVTWIGEHAFSGLGIAAGKNIVWNTDFSETDYEETAFDKCKNKPNEAN